MAENQYPFLDLKTPKDASSLINKITHSIYQAIVKKSTVQNAKNSALFTTETKVDGILLNSKSEYVYPIKRLIEDKLVQQLFYFYSTDQRILLQTCYVAIPTEKTNNLNQIYENLIITSVNNIENYLEFQMNFNIDDFKREVERNLKENPPFLPENFPNSLIRIFQGVDDHSIEIPLDSFIVETTTKEIENELIEKNKIIKIENGLFMPLAKNQILERFEIANECIKGNMHPDAAIEIAAINSDEEIFNMTPFHEIDISFPVKRARLLHNNNSRPDHHYPGELANITVLLLENLVVKLYKKQQEETIRKETEFLKNKFLEHSENWKSLIHFFDDSAISSKHPKVWDKLKRDNALAFASWFLKKEEIYVFASRKSEVFITSIESMEKNPPGSGWQILAFRYLLEQNEKYLPGLFINKKIVNAYGNLLRSAYIAYFPWFYQIFIFVDFFRDMFFSSAKQKISREQESFRDRIRKRKLDLEKKQTIERLKVLELKNNEIIRNQIIVALDEFYFKDGQIPSVNQVMQKCKMKDVKQLQTVLQRENFQMIPLIKGGGFENIAVLFPLDHTWRKKEAKLKKLLFEKIESFSDSIPKDNNEILPFKLLYNHILSHNRKMAEEKIEEDLDEIEIE